ncbi:DsbA family oxidoreductase [Pseudomonas abietaniphila]|uniref:Predicted dithiol-disulfide isomerase, DsbA family n=1 Tax=Pseudomonas abietaniphila TaxID=89065 RepID=A0A1G8CSU6_9PSED|nr:DsbA family oxidoreductase [Pseudomonas abietaniphila]SDH48627.1 Predicted dithiol-disulfide isomerase, DsbA family [Pseudomonas abietaniphila]
MSTPLKIDFISDVSCPWCIIGLRALDQALEHLGDEVQAHIHFQPFELNPKMVPEGQEIFEHIAEKYGSTHEQYQANAENIRERGAELGFVFKPGDRRIYNTFDAHRLLHWAELEGKQQALKEALFTAYFSQHADVSSHKVLADVAQKVGMDRVRAEAVLASDQYAAQVRELEELWVTRGVSSVPTIVFNDQYAVTGGQPVDVFVGAIRQIISEQSSVVNADE